MIIVHVYNLNLNNKSKLKLFQTEQIKSEVAFPF